VEDDVPLSTVVILYALENRIVPIDHDHDLERLVRLCENAVDALGKTSS